MIKFLFFFFFLSLSPLFALFVSNPSDPVLFKEGVFLEEHRWWHFRSAYISEYVYENQCKPEFIREVMEDSYSKMFNNYGIFTVNMFCWWDLYAIIGSSRMEIDNQVFPKANLAWGAGTKVLFFKRGNFDFSLDFKYFCTEVTPTYFLLEEVLANIVYSKLTLNYEAWQAALAFSYRSKYFVPYIGLTYFDCKVSSKEPIFNLELPNIPYMISLSYDPYVSKRDWGLVLGVTLISCPSTSFTLETRSFNQGAITSSLQIRF